MLSEERYCRVELSLLRRGMPTRDVRTKKARVFDVVILVTYQVLSFLLVTFEKEATPPVVIR